MKRVWISATAAAVLGAAAAWAHPVDEAWLPTLIKRLDRNHDGKLTREEFGAQREDVLRQRFRRLDTDGDGQISFDEFRSAHERRAERRFRRLDANRDGAVDAEEIQLALRRLRRHLPWLHERD